VIPPLPLPFILQQHNTLWPFTFI